jgi:NADH-quinone oxidoreductase subunit J
LIALIAFYLFATLTIASAVAVIFARNPVHSVLWLILAFFNAAGLMLIMGAEFIAMLLVIVYVGAVAVLFLFVVMMLDIDFAKLRSGFTRNLPFGLIIALVLVAEIIIALSAWEAGPALSGRTIPESPQPNIVALGQLLYSRFLLPFELAGLILLVAMIGAIVLTHRNRRDHRGQNISRQIRRDPKRAVKNLQPASGEGVELLPHRRGDPVHHRCARHLPQPPQHHPAADGDRAHPARGEPQPGRFLGLSRRSHRPGVCDVRADRRRRRSSDRARDPRHLLPPQGQHRGR